MHKSSSFMFGESRLLVLYTILLNGYPSSLSLEKNWTRFDLDPIGFTKSYFFEHEKIKKPLQLPEILGPLKAQK